MKKGKGFYAISLQLESKLKLQKYNYVIAMFYKTCLWSYWKENKPDTKKHLLTKCSVSKLTFFPIIDFNIKFNTDESYLKYNIKLKKVLLSF